MLRSTSNESRGGKFHPLSLFLLSALRVSYRKLRFPESSPFGRRSFERIGFQPTCNTIACLQFDHSQRFESTTDRFALQLYGNFNWKYGQIGLLCSLCTDSEDICLQTLTSFSITWIKITRACGWQKSFRAGQILCAQTNFQDDFRQVSILEFPSKEAFS